MSVTNLKKENLPARECAPEEADRRLLCSLRLMPLRDQLLTQPIEISRIGFSVPDCRGRQIGHGHLTIAKEHVVLSFAGRNSFVLHELVKQCEVAEHEKFTMRVHLEFFVSIAHGVGPAARHGYMPIGGPDSKSVAGLDFEIFRKDWERDQEVWRQLLLPLNPYRGVACPNCGQAAEVNQQQHGLIRAQMFPGSLLLCRNCGARFKYQQDYPPGNWVSEGVAPVL